MPESLPNHCQLKMKQTQHTYIHHVFSSQYRRSHPAKYAIHGRILAFATAKYINIMPSYRTYSFKIKKKEKKNNETEL